MTKKYQTIEVGTSALAVPEQVQVAMAEIAGGSAEGLLALAVGAGLQVMQQLMEADVDRGVWAAGPARSGSVRDPAWQRAGLGDPGWPAGAGQPAPGPRRRRLR